MTQAPVRPDLIRSDEGVEPRLVAKWGLLGGLIAVFVSAIGMFEVFTSRLIVDPYLNLGWIALYGFTLYFGYLVTKQPVLEGMEPPKVGAHNVVAGLLTGAIAGAVVGAFLLLADLVNLRDPLINVSPPMLRLLSFEGPLGTAALIHVGVGAIVGAVGGAFHLLPSRHAKLLMTGVLAVLIAALLELVVGNALREAGFIDLDRWFYSPRRGLNPVPAALIFFGALALRLALTGKFQKVSNRYQELPDKGKRRAAFIIALVLLALGAYLPAFFGTFVNDVLSNVGLFILLALGLNIVVGYAGMLDLGYVAFFAVGAYTAAVVTSPRSPKITPELAFFEAMPWVLLMAAIAGLIIGTPVIRMRGDYLAIVTLGFGEIARIAFLSDWLANVFGAAQGILRISWLDLGDREISGIRVNIGYVIAAVGIVALLVGALRWREARRIERAEVDPIPGTSLRTSTGLVIMGLGLVALVVGLLSQFPIWTVIGIEPEAMLRIILVFVAIAAFVSWRLQESRVGRAWTAVREDEQIAQTMGVNIVTTKLLAFVMGAMLASLGGALFAVKLGTIFPHSFEILQSIIILVIVIVGGMGSIKGVVMGAVVLIGILGGPTQPGLLREFGEFKLLIYGVILVWMMLQRPEGLWPNVRRTRELHMEEMMQDAWLREQADKAKANEAREGT
jgi:branched-chain amino acid transport system permease protein